MATEYLRVLVNTVAIRDEPGSTDRLGDFTKNDAVKLIKPCTSDGVPEWVEVDMVGAIREPAEEGRERPSKGFVRTRNRVATLLEPWTDIDEAATARDDQAAKRNDGTSWFKSATRTAASAASHAKPLLAGGREEYERRQRLLVLEGADRLLEAHDRAYWQTDAATLAASSFRADRLYAEKCTQPDTASGGFDEHLREYVATIQRRPLQHGKMLILRDEFRGVGLGHQLVMPRIALWLGLATRRATFIQKCDFYATGGTERVPRCSEPHFSSTALASS